MILEACVGNLQQALNAEKQGAHQIELCDRLDLDGTSPTLDTVNSVCKKLSIPIKVIVNPNPFHYVYNLKKDIEKIYAYIEALNNYPINGIVFGPIDHNGNPDLDLILDISKITNYPITFHKAIDSSSNILKSTASLANQNIVKFILTSGGHKTALEGAENLKKINALLKDTSINPIAAGKITNNNLNSLHKKVGLAYYHGKKVVGDLED